MTREPDLPLTVLAWEGPQARAYLVRMRRAGLQPERDHRSWCATRGVEAATRGRAAASGAPNAPRTGRTTSIPTRSARTSPELVDAIGGAMAAVVDDPMGSYDGDVRRLLLRATSRRSARASAPNSYRDPAVVAALEQAGAGTVIFTGGGIVPRAGVRGPRHPARPRAHRVSFRYVRGADVLLWSLLVRGRPGVSAFFMTPGLDDGDVLAAQELEPLQIELPAGSRFDDDTLYRAVFSFVDPLIRAELLVADVLERADDPRDLPGAPQDLGAGITYHFMHPIVRSRALAELFERAADPRRGKLPRPTSGPVAGALPEVLRTHVGARAPMRFALDAARAKSSLRRRSIQNRQKDYSGLAGAARAAASCTAR